MQWLIVIIAEKVIATIGIPPCYVDRGDPADYDWDINSLTQDNAWHDLDCSAIVPAGAQAIHFFCLAKNPSIQRTFTLRKKGNVNMPNIAQLRTHIADQFVSSELICKCDPDRFVSYRAIVPAWTALDLVIRGWWL